ncbi:MAG: hypothetical protein JWR46_2332 [Mycobacterium sp.]|jgi:hypothetical protein|nr:hypothetical protein [Mycobacterium sp.]MCW2733673.1 hypothetical protein [Mycobacterium sp.]MDT5316328.1 hypothetical protein [Mycobacterium sp.]
MDVVGWAATGLVAVVVVVGVAVGLSSLPDIKRYLRIRNM